MDLCTLAAIVEEKYDPDELVDLLHISSRDLLRAFPHRLAILRENFASEEYWDTSEIEDNQD